MRTISLEGPLGISSHGEVILVGAKTTFGPSHGFGARTNGIPPGTNTASRGTRAETYFIVFSFLLFRGERLSAPVFCSPCPLMSFPLYPVFILCFPCSVRELPTIQPHESVGMGV